MVVITGANGFIGSHLNKLFKDCLKCDVNNRNMVHPNDLFYRIRDKKPDTIFHLGAISSTTETKSVAITENNILLSCKILEYCIKEGVNFVYASSASVYGLGEEGFKEDIIARPLNYYANSKMSFDFFASQKILDHPNAKIIGLRYFNVYGPNEDHKQNMASPVHKFFKQAEETKKIKIFKGSEYFLRDFIHVDDVVSITKQSVNFPSGIYNVGTGIARSFLDVAEIISSLTNANIKEIPFPNHLQGKYQEFTCSDNTKITSVGYIGDRISLEDGIMRTVNA
jgi:ADP-L-glycero-D-manno-heptose 6-epimerase